ncbi:MAG: hypothetical protein ACYTF0_09595, partial [Planctomycetota bacterium]
MIQPADAQRPSIARHWRILQAILLAVGLGIIAALLFAPDLGIDLLWNGLVPIAPALLVFAPGLWRNICPLATAVFIPRSM